MSCCENPLEIQKSRTLYNMDDPNDKIAKLVEQRKRANAYYGKNSAVYRAFLSMEKEAFADGALSKMEKELIAVGISVVINCESCMEWHIRQAIDAGAGKEQLLDAVGVGIEMGGGPATVSARFAMEVIESYIKIK